MTDLDRPKSGFKRRSLTRSITIFCLKYLRKWRNWHTRMFEGHVPQGLRVQIPPSALLSSLRVKPERAFILWGGIFRHKALANPSTKRLVDESADVLWRRTGAAEPFYQSRRDHKERRHPSRQRLTYRRHAEVSEQSELTERSRA